MSQSPQQIGKLYRSVPRGQPPSPQEIGKLYHGAPSAGGCLGTLVVWGLVAFGLWLKFGGWVSIVATVKGWIPAWLF